MRAARGGARGQQAGGAAGQGGGDGRGTRQPHEELAHGALCFHAPRWEAVGRRSSVCGFGMGIWPCSVFAVQCQRCAAARACILPILFTISIPGAVKAALVLPPPRSQRFFYYPSCSLNEAVCV